MQGTPVQSLVGELRFHVPRGTAKKKKKLTVVMIARIYKYPENFKMYA